MVIKLNKNEQNYFVTVLTPFYIGWGKGQYVNGSFTIEAFECSVHDIAVQQKVADIATETIKWREHWHNNCTTIMC